MPTTSHIDLPQSFQQILRVTAQAWGLASPARSCNGRPETAAPRRPLCRAQASYFSMAY
jgi:hypothetical protein